MTYIRTGNLHSPFNECALFLLCYPIKILLNGTIYIVIYDYDSVYILAFTNDHSILLLGEFDDSDDYDYVIN